MGKGNLFITCFNELQKLKAKCCCFLFWDKSLHQRWFRATATMGV